MNLKCSLIGSLWLTQKVIKCVYRKDLYQNSSANFNIKILRVFLKWYLQKTEDNRKRKIKTQFSSLGRESTDEQNVATNTSVLSTINQLGAHSPKIQGKKRGSEGQHYRQWKHS